MDMDLHQPAASITSSPVSSISDQAAQPPFPSNLPPGSQPDAPLRFAHSPYSASYAVPDSNGNPAAKKPRAPRKKKADAATAENDPESSEKQKRAPAKPRDSNKPPLRKKQKVLDEAASSSSGEAATIKVALPASQASSLSTIPPSIPAGQTFNPKDNGDHAAVRSTPHVQEPPKPKTTTSGPYYDPIRGSSTTSTPQLSTLLSPPPPPSRPSPSISSLINPPEPTPAHAVPLKGMSTPLSHEQNPPQRPPAPSASAQPASTQSFVSADLTQSTKPSAAEDTKPSTSAKPKDSLQKANSPKPARYKDQTPSLTLGNGLLSNAAFGKADEDHNPFAEVPNQCIIIEVPMKSESGHCYVNFMQEVEKKYGFDVAHPRLAEHRRRMKQIAAAGAALESGAGSADEMAIDFSDADSNIEMGGVDDDSAPDGPKKKRRAKRDDYNKDDDFIDDTELMWEEQALASKDGYFVWAGPLVPEGDKPSVERADGTVKRGRGGRGRGSGRGTASSKGEGSTRGRGSGARARGSGTVRKRGPKTTENKAEVALKMEADKAVPVATALAASSPAV